MLQQNHGSDAGSGKRETSARTILRRRRSGRLGGPSGHQAPPPTPNKRSPHRRRVPGLPRARDAGHFGEACPWAPPARRQRSARAEGTCAEWPSGWRFEITRGPRPAAPYFRALAVRDLSAVPVRPTDHLCPPACRSCLAAASRRNGRRQWDPFLYAIGRQQRYGEELLKSPGSTVGHRRRRRLQEANAVISDQDRRLQHRAL